jgi:hypothetical protein
MPSVTSSTPIGNERGTLGMALSGPNTGRESVLRHALAATASRWRVYRVWAAANRKRRARPHPPRRSNVRITRFIRASTSTVMLPRLHDAIVSLHCSGEAAPVQRLPSPPV